MFNKFFFLSKCKAGKYSEIFRYFMRITMLKYLLSFDALSS